MNYTREDPLALSAEVEGRESVTPATAPLWRGLAYLLEFVPSYRDSRQGRKTATQVRVLLIGLGILLMAFGGAESGGWIVLGALLAFSAFVVPMGELDKRSRRADFKRRSGPQERRVFEEGRLEFDGQKLTLFVGDEKLRHIRVDRGKHDLVEATGEEFTYLGVQPPGGRKKESIWVRAELATGELAGADEKQRELGSRVASVEEEKLDRPARVSPGDFERLRRVLGGVS